MAYAFEDFSGRLRPRERSRIFSTNNGPAESLKVPARHGCGPNAFQIRTTALCGNLEASVTKRLPRCGAPSGRW
jgi:hypothetical protein